MEESQHPGEVLLPEAWSAEDIEPWLLKHAQSIMPQLPIESSLSLFEQGLDRYDDPYPGLAYSHLTFT